MRVSIFILLGLFISNILYSQGDTPCTASTLTINYACVEESGMLDGSTSADNGFSTPICASYSSSPDVWYKIIAPASGSVRVTLIEGTLTDSGMAFYSATNCSTPGVELYCDDDGGSGLMSQIEATGLTPGNEYYIRIWDYDDGATGTFGICVKNLGTPPNDECAGATTVTVNTGSSCTTLAYSSVEGATASAQSLDACLGTADDDVWFKFVATKTIMNISLNNVEGSVTDMYHAVYSGTCGALTNIKCSDSDQSSVTGLTIGNTYYIRVYTVTAVAGQNTEFDLCVAEPPDNILCNSLEPICSGTPTVFTAQATGSTAEAGNNYDCLSTRPNPTWYYLEIDNPGLLAIDIIGSSDVDFAIWGPYSSLANAKAACGTLPLPKDCSYSISATERAEVAGTLNGEVYVLLVTNYASVVQTITLDQAPTAVATTNCAVVLPAGLVSFEVKFSDEKGEITWESASEFDLKYYAVQKSLDGKKWETIQIEEPNGGKEKSAYYQFIDRLIENEIQYYRLKMVDINGDIEYSIVKSLNRGKKSYFVYPTICNDLVSINDFEDEIENVQVRNIVGDQAIVNIEKRNGKWNLDTSDLKSGVYLVDILVNGKYESTKIIKQ